MKTGKFKTKDIAIMAMLTAILFAQEEILTIVPQFQLTVLLIILYAKTLGFTKTTIIVTIHVILDNLVMGSLNYIYTPFMWIGWMFIPILLCTVFKKVEKPLSLALLSIMFSLLYSWSFIIPSIFMNKISFGAYMIADIPFEVMLAVFSFITVFWLYKPLNKVLVTLNDYNFNNSKND